MQFKLFNTHLFIFIFAFLITVSDAAYAVMGEVWTSNNSASREYFSFTKKEIHEDYVVYTYGKSTDLLIREYVNSLGIVFAVTWNGAYLPNFKKLLSDRYLDKYMGSGGLVMSPQLNINKDDFILKSYGNSRNFRGYAYDVKIVPSDFDLKSLQ